MPRQPLYQASIVSPARVTGFVLGTLFLLLSAAGCSLPQPEPGTGNENKRPYVILVSLDGFRHDFSSLTDTPAMDRMASEGLKAEALQPVFPTLTFPNHFSIATGRLPQHHGIVANRFPDDKRDRWYSLYERATVEDGSWYLAEPVWVTAEKQGVRTAAYYFVGTESDAFGVRPSDWRPFVGGVPGEERVDQVLEWLRRPESQRPHLVTLYFEDVDSKIHWYGLGSVESLQSIRDADRWLGRLRDGIARLSISGQTYIILVSDHGMAVINRKNALVLESVISLDDLQIVEGGPYAFLHFSQPNPPRALALRDTINRQWNCGEAFRPEELPDNWQAGSSARYPDLVVQAAPGCAVVSTEERLEKLQRADHGWAPDVPEMHGILYATGPRIPAGTRTGTVHVTDIQPLITELLKLDSPGAVDGNPNTLTSLLLPE